MLRAFFEQSGINPQNGVRGIDIFSDDETESAAEQKHRGLAELCGRFVASMRYYSSIDGKKSHHSVKNVETKSLLDFLYKKRIGINGKPFSGANRNRALVNAAGSAAISCDDDVYWNPVQLRNTVIATDRGSVPSLLTFAEVNSLKRFVLPSEIDLADAFFDELGSDSQSDGPRAAPKIAMSGLYGGRWFSNPAAYLAVPASLQKAVWPSRKAFTVAKCRPWALLLAPERTYTNVPFFISACFSYNAAEILPPFLPGIRAAEAVWAVMVRRMYPASPICHVEAAVEHSFEEKGGFMDDPLNTVMPGTSQIIRTLIGALVPAQEGLQPEEILRGIGLRLRSVAAMSNQGRRKLILELYVAAAAARAEELDRQLRNEKGTPWWRKDAERYLALTRKQACEPLCWIPSEFRVSDGENHAEQEFSLYLTQCAELCIAWPEIWSLVLNHSIVATERAL